jgi:hemerythrin superfamily protein
MNALELLKQDHEEVKELFEQAEGADDSKEQRDIFKQLKKALESHARIEEGIFYPAMEKHAHLKDLVLESYEEHKQIKILLKEMDDLVTDSEDFEPKLRVLQEIVEHHAEEEEEGNMFPQVRELVDDTALEELGRKLETAKGIQSPAA